MTNSKTPEFGGINPTSTEELLIKLHDADIHGSSLEELERIAAFITQQTLEAYRQGKLEVLKNYDAIAPNEIKDRIAFLEAQLKKGHHE